jgi:hypothetical protein
MDSLLRKASHIFKQSKPPQLPNSQESEDCSKTNAILAFRTITTMLSLIQPTNRNNTEPTNVSKEQRYELRVLDALSAVLVRRHEIAAVMTKHNNGSGIQVLASANNLEPALLTIPQSEGVSSRSPLRWFITPNPRDPARNPNSKLDSLTTQSIVPALVDPDTGISEQLSNAEDLLNTFLQTQWRVFR